MNKREEERKIIREVIYHAYDRNIKHDVNFEEIEKIREWITRIVELEAQEMGYRTRVIIGDKDIEELTRQKDNGELILNFYNNNKDDTMGDFCVRFGELANHPEPLTPVIRINEYGYEYVFKNEKEDPIDPFMCIIDTPFHELRHMQRHLMARIGLSSYIALMYVKEKFIRIKLDGLEEKIYDSTRTEEDANIWAVKRWHELSERNRRLARKYSSYYEICETKIQRDDFAFMTFDQLMKEEGNRYILELYPILQKEYNGDGTKKSSKELLKNMKSEVEEYLNIDGLSDAEKDILITDCKGMYFEIIYREMNTIQDMTSLAETYDKDDNTALFSEMKLYFEERYKSEKQGIKETGRATSTERKEIKSRQKYYQEKIDFLTLLVKQQQKENFLNGIINKGKKFVRTR